MPNKALLYGNLTIDDNETESGRYKGPGGSVYFMAKTFANFGTKPIVVSPYGTDFPKSMLSEVLIYPEKPPCEKTLVFKNVYHSKEGRRQWVKGCEDAALVSFQNLRESITSQVDCLVIAPIIDNITAEQIRDLVLKVKPALSVLLPQGFFRRVDKSGRIREKDWKKDKEILPFFDIVVASEDDYHRIDTKAIFWSKNFNIVIITREDKGCTIYKDGERFDYSAFKAELIVDSTGAGDVFAAVFSYFYFYTKDISYSAICANAASCMSLRSFPDKLQYSKKDVDNFIQSYKNHKSKNKDL